MSVRDRVGIFVVGLVALGSFGPASALQVYVDQTASYRYIDATGTAGTNCSGTVAPANWFGVGFDDSAWKTGNGPFSSGATSGTIFDNPNANAPFAPGPTQPIPTTFTQWDVFNCPLARTTFTLAQPTALTIWIAIDNGIGLQGSQNAGLYFNGVQTTNSVNAEGAAFRWEVAYDVPASFTFAGTNLIALELEDHGGATGFDMMVTAQSSDPNIPGFSTNPPPPQPGAVPEPVTLALVGLAFAGMGLARRRKLN